MNLKIFIFNSLTPKWPFAQLILFANFFVPSWIFVPQLQVTHIFEIYETRSKIFWNINRIFKRSTWLFPFHNFTDFEVFMVFRSRFKISEVLLRPSKPPQGIETEKWQASLNPIFLEILKILFLRHKFEFSFWNFVRTLSFFVIKAWTWNVLAGKIRCKTIVWIGA